MYTPQKRKSYSESFRSAMVQKVLTSPTRSAIDVAREAGISPSTLYRWIERAGGSVPKKNDKAERRPEDWSAAEKLAVVFEADKLDDEELGAFLRSRGLHSHHLEAWRSTAMAALGKPSKKRGNPKLRAENQKLKRELRRKDKALAEATALVVLSKKARALWEDEGNDT